MSLYAVLHSLLHRSAAQPASSHTTIQARIHVAELRFDVLLRAMKLEGA